MIRQTDRSTETPNGVRGGIGEVVRDFASLTELQAELLRVDAKEAAARLAAPLILLVVAGALALGTIPVLLLFVANALAAAGLAYWLALLIAVVLGFAAAGIAAAVGVQMLRMPFRTFQRSRDEFKRNIDWLKRTVARHARADPEES